MLSLTVEFYRAQPSNCLHDDRGNPISPHAANFPYNDDPKCNLACSVERGPHSPLRDGSANEIFVIPAPDKITFGTAMLLAAACCIPAVLSLMWIWYKILQMNWDTRFGEGNDSERFKGINGATVHEMKTVNEKIRKFLVGVEFLVFGSAVLAIIIVGEWNFFSAQVRYQTEPIASIGRP